MRDPAEALQRLAREYPSLFDEAYQAVREGKVKKYYFYPSGKVEWIVVGRNRDYLILPEANYCSCEDFFFRVLSQEKPMCYHILATRIAALTGRYEEIQEADHWRRRLIKEWVPREE